MTTRRRRARRTTTNEFVPNMMPTSYIAIAIDRYGHGPNVGMVLWYHTSIYTRCACTYDDVPYGMVLMKNSLAGGLVPVGFPRWGKKYYYFISIVSPN